MTSHRSPTQAPLPEARVLRQPETFSFVGPLEAVGLHVHRAPALLIALDRPIRLRAAGSDWQRIHGAWIPAGLAHELDCGGAPLAVVYFDPARGDIRPDASSLLLAGPRTDWVRTGRALAWDPSSGDAREDTAWRSLAEHASRGHAKPASSRSRTGGFLDGLTSGPDDIWNLSLRQAATRVGLSPHRFSHRFSSELGLSWVAYRNWIRLMASTADSFSGQGSLTDVAMLHGYSTPSHFAACFRAHFGIRPSDLLRLRAPAAQPQPQERSAMTPAKK